LGPTQICLRIGNRDVLTGSDQAQVSVTRGVRLNPISKKVGRILTPPIEGQTNVDLCRLSLLVDHEPSDCL